MNAIYFTYKINIFIQLQSKIMVLFYIFQIEDKTFNQPGQNATRTESLELDPESLDNLLQGFRRIRDQLANVTSRQ